MVCGAHSGANRARFNFVRRNHHSPDGTGFAVIQGMNALVKILSHPGRLGRSSVLGLLVGTAQAAAPAYQPLADIAQTAVDHVETHGDRFPVPPQVAAGSLDSRLRLHHCDQPLESFESPGGLKAGRAVIGVRCTGTRPWKLFVPVEIKLPSEVVVLARPLRRGDVISAADLTTRMADLARLRGQYYLDSTDLVGQRIKRHVAGNAVLTPSMIDADRLVERGARVTILSDAGAIEVRVAGKAMGHGGRGDQIRVKNQASGRTISAVVVDRGVVKANP